MAPLTGYGEPIPHRTRLQRIYSHPAAAAEDAQAKLGRVILGSAKVPQEPLNFPVDLAPVVATQPLPEARRSQLLACRGPQRLAICSRGPISLGKKLIDLSHIVAAQCDHEFPRHVLQYLRYHGPVPFAVQSASDAQGNATLYTYDGAGNLLQPASTLPATAKVT